MLEKLKGNKPLLLAVVVIIILAIVGGVHWHDKREAALAASELTLKGNVDLREVSLAFRGSDRISEIFVDEGDTVKKGQVLAKLDTEDLTRQMDVTKSDIAAQQAVVDKLHNGTRAEDLAQAEAKYRAAQAQQNFASSDYDKKQAAYTASKGRSVSKDTLDAAKAQLDSANAQTAEAKAAYDLAVAGPRAEDVAAGEAKLDALQNTLSREQYNLDQAELVAPQDGVIRSRLLEVGDMASPQHPVFRIALNTKKWVRVYVKESDLGKVHEGQDADVYIDSAKTPVKGQVGYISSSAEFTPKNVETSELRTALLYEVRVYVTDPDNKLRMGMPATVKVKI